MKIYEEDEAVAFIKNCITAEGVSDDAILEIIDAIFDCYDDNGELEIDFDDDPNDKDAPIDKETLIKTVIENLDHLNVPDNVIREIIEAELAYEDSLL